MRSVALAIVSFALAGTARAQTNAPAQANQPPPPSVNSGASPATGPTGPVQGADTEVAPPSSAGRTSTSDTAAQSATPDSVHETKVLPRTLEKDRADAVNRGRTGAARSRRRRTRTDAEMNAPALAPADAPPPDSSNTGAASPAGTAHEATDPTTEPDTQPAPPTSKSTKQTPAPTPAQR